MSLSYPHAFGWKGHMDRDKGGRIEGGRWGWLRWGGVVGEEMETTVLEQQ